MATATSCSTTATTTAPVASGSQSGDDHHRHHAADLSAVDRLFRHDRPGGHLRLPGLGAVRPPLMAAAQPDQEDRKSGVEGKRVSGRVNLGGLRIIKKKKKIT